MKNTFTRRDYYNAILSWLAGDEPDDLMRDELKDFCFSNIERLDREKEKSREKTAALPKRDPLESNYAVALRRDVVPFVDSTPRTASELAAIATANGLKAPSGKEYSPLWIARVLKAEPGVNTVNKIVIKTNDKGLKTEHEVMAFSR